MSRILVTGGAGFVGTNLIKRLLSDGHRVVSLDNYSTGFKKNHVNGCDYFDIDITKISDYSFYMDKPDVIFHLAALARIQPSIKNPKETIKNNFGGTLNVLEFARYNNSQVIYAGSSSKHHGLYGSPYAWSKYGGEELCKLYSEVYDLNTSICRFYNVYGPNHIRKGTYATVLGIFENQYLNGEPLTITGTGEQRRDFTHVDDIVDGLIRCVGKKYKAEEFEFGTGKNYSINEVAKMFNHETTYISARPGEYDVTLCDYSKAKKYLGYEPVGNLQNYVDNFIKDN
tara:strand:+ start:56 stop:910 length:855 start_codon:yes stop_codon:yes gene_type:complete